MSQPANDEFSQHLSDDEASNHEDCIRQGAAPKQQIQKNGNSKSEFLLEWLVLFEYFHSISAAEILAVEKERKSKNICDGHFPRKLMRSFHGLDDE
ncbi:hypothetical protein Tco_0728376 [Tanacetum coccineum]|uniref:Uncharacterized protein n=1 Tax=Tanacetum coccineum TaxID=301880 RepID=A0ABQ4YLG6_9ASTR